MLIEDLVYYKRSANYTNNTSGIDHPHRSKRNTKGWYSYPIQDFNYQFNSWGFRGPEYKQYIGKPVNICLGDSFTVNVGGPIEHSWCSQLAKNFDIPTLNMGMDGAGNDAIKIVYNRACEIFDVQNTFVMYSYFHRRLSNNNEFVHFDNSVFNFDELIFYFYKNFIDGAFYTFVPSWCWSKDELTYLENNHKKNLYKLNQIDLEDIHTSMVTYITKDEYNFYKGSDWISYDRFKKGQINKIMLEDDYFINHILERYINKNRDGNHLDQKANKIVADFFWEKFNAS